MKHYVTILRGCTVNNNIIAEKFFKKVKMISKNILKTS